MLLWRKKLSIAGLGRLIGLNRSSTSLKMNGHQRWYFDEIQMIARQLETSVAYLTGETNDPHPLNAEVPASAETGTGSVARAGLEPATPRL